MSEEKVEAPIFDGPLSREAKLEIQEYIDLIQEAIDDIEVAVDEAEADPLLKFSSDEWDYLKAIGVVRIETTASSEHVKLTFSNGDTDFKTYDQIIEYANTPDDISDEFLRFLKTPTREIFLIDGTSKEIHYGYQALAVLENEFGSMLNLTKILERGEDTNFFQTLSFLIWAGTDREIPYNAFIDLLDITQIGNYANTITDLFAETFSAISEVPTPDSSCSHDDYAIATAPRTEYSTDAGASWHPWNTGLIYGLNDNESVAIRHYCQDGNEANWSVEHCSEDDYCECDEPSNFCLPSYLCIVAFVASMASLVLSLVGR